MDSGKVQQVLGPALERENLTQEGLAQRIGMSRKVVNEYLNHKPPREETAYRIAQVLKLSDQECDMLYEGWWGEDRAKNARKWEKIGRSLSETNQASEAIALPAIPLGAGNLPAYYIERTELTAQLTQYVLDSDRGQIVVLKGIDGAGKTTLLKALLRQADVQKHFIEFFWLDCLVKGGELLQLAQQLDPSLLSNKVDQYTLRLQIASQLKDRQVLIVIDNPTDVQQVKDLAEILSKSSKLVVATPGDDWYDIGPVFKDNVITVDILSTDESLMLVEKILKGTDLYAIDKAMTLAQLTGQLALGVEIAANLVRSRKGWTSTLEGLQIDYKMDELQHGQKSVERVFNLSYETLSDEEKRCFHIFGLFSYISVSVDEITNLLKPDLPDWPRKNIVPCLDKLQNYALVQILEEHLYGAHLLVSDYAAKMADKLGYRHNLLHRYIRFYSALLNDMSNVFCHFQYDRLTPFFGEDTYHFLPKLVSAYQWAVRLDPQSGMPWLLIWP